MRWRRVEEWPRRQAGVSESGRLLQVQPAPASGDIERLGEPLAPLGRRQTAVVEQRFPTRIRLPLQSRQRRSSIGGVLIVEVLQLGEMQGAAVVIDRRLLVAL